MIKIVAKAVPEISCYRYSTYGIGSKICETVNNERSAGALSSWKMKCLPSKFLHTAGHKFSFTHLQELVFASVCTKIPTA